MGGDTVGQIVYDARINTQSLRGDASTTEGIIQGVAQRSANSFRTFSTQASTAFGSIAGGIGKLAVVAGGLFVGGAFSAKTFIDSASELQGMRASFESMTGSAEKASEVLAALNKFSFETAFSSAQINKAAQLLLGAGLEADKLGKYMKNIGDVAGATGADLGALTLPLSQALARGKLQTQDFYQILNSGAGKLGQVLREELARRGMGDFQKAMEQGKVTSAILFDVIAKSAAKGGFAFDGAIRQANTFNGRMSNLAETINNVALKVLGVNKATGEVNPNGLFAKLSAAVLEATRWLDANKQAITNVVTVIIQNAIPTMAALTAAFIVAKAAAIGFAIASSVTPIGLMAAAIVGLVAVLTFLEVKFRFASSAVAWMGQQLRPVIDLFNKYALPVIRAVASFIGGQFRQALGDLSAAWRDLQRAVAPLMPVLKVVASVIGVTVVVAIGAAIGIVAAIIAAFARLIGWVARVAGGFASMVSQVIGAMSSFVGSVASGISSAVSYFAALPGRILRAVGNLGGLLYDAGRDLINGFTKGVSDFAGNVANAAKQAASSAVNNVKNMLGIHSPSRVMMWIGEMMMSGMGRGIDRNAHSAASSASNASGRVLGAFSSNVMSPSISPDYDGAGGVAAGSHKEIHIGAIHIAKEVDGEYWLNRLTGNQEDISAGLVPRQSYGAAA